MMRNQVTTQNPLARAALAVPDRWGWAISLLARAAGGGLALAVAVDQSYQRTRLLAVAVAVAALLSLMPLPRFAPRLAWIGAGVLFFGGALLWHLPAGAGTAVAGAIAAVGIAIDDRQRGRVTGVPGFFMGLGITLVLVTAIVLGIDG